MSSLMTTPTKWLLPVAREPTTEMIMSVPSRELSGAGIIFLLDPMQIPTVVSQLDDSVVERAAAIKWQQAARADDIMTRVSTLIRNDRGLPDRSIRPSLVGLLFSPRADTAK